MDLFSLILLGLRSSFGKGKQAKRNLKRLGLLSFHRIIWVDGGFKSYFLGRVQWFAKLRQTLLSDWHILYMPSKHRFPSTW